MTKDTLTTINDSFYCQIKLSISLAISILYFTFSSFSCFSRPLIYLLAVFNALFINFLISCPKCPPSPLKTDIFLLQPLDDYFIRNKQVGSFETLTSTYLHEAQSGVYSIYFVLRVKNGLIKGRNLPIAQLMMKFHSKDPCISYHVVFCVINVNRL